MSEFNKDSLGNILFVAIGVCLVCSVIVSTAAVALKPMQVRNAELDQKENILRAAGLLPPGATADAQGRSVDQLFSEFETRAVNLDTGEFVDMDTDGYDPLKAAKDPSESIKLTSDQDIATIGRRENVSIVYIKRKPDGSIDKLVMPVRGYGLWGTLYGYLALDGDLDTISGLGFYSQKETPGLGGEVDNPQWKAKWPGVKLYGDDGEPAVRLVKVRAPEGSAMASHEVDALSGATLTSRGVQHLVRFWTGDLGFGPFIKNLKSTS